MIRLVTHADLGAGATDARQLSVSARLEAVLSDGRSLVLLDDRGWSESGPPGSRLRISREEVERTTRMVVGPDEPFGGRTQEQMAAGHWTHLAAVLARRGVDADPRRLERLPHEVVLSERLRACIS